MIVGRLSDDRIPVIPVSVAGVTYSAVVDTGFNGYLELPRVLQPVLKPRYTGRVTSLLAGGQRIEEDTYLVNFPFDGQIVEASVTFVDGNEILLGTQMLAEYRLEIDFTTGRVALDRG